MRYSELQDLSNAEFKRLCGVSRTTFAEMVEVLRPHLERRGQRGGQAKLSVEDQLLVALEYWREYRSQFHIAVSWGIHETTVGRIVRKVEDLLVKCGMFRLPSQRQLYQPGWEWKVMRVDVGEMEIERPQKNRNATTVASKSAIRGKRNCWWSLRVDRLFAQPWALARPMTLSYSNAVTYRLCHRSCV